MTSGNVGDRLIALDAQGILYADDGGVGKMCLWRKCLSTFSSFMGIDWHDRCPRNPRVVTAKQPRTRSVSRLTAFILVWALGVPLAHGVAPWAISQLSRRYGWESSSPGTWNVLGLVPIALGIGGLAWIMIAAFRKSPKRIELRAAAFLTTRGPYAFSRNPMYVSELTLWLGWAVFYGNVAVLIGFAILFVALVASARYEERVLEARFGDAYRAYKSTIPRWLGTRRRLRP